MGSCFRSFAIRSSISTPMVRRAGRPEGSGTAAAPRCAPRAALAAMIESGRPAVHRVVRWRIVDSAMDLRGFRVVVYRRTLSRELRAIGYRSFRLVPDVTRRLLARPRILRKSCRSAGRDRARDRVAAEAVEAWFADEARVAPKQDHPPAGQPGARPTLPEVGDHLHLFRRDLPQGRQGRGPCHAQMRHRGDEPAPGRNRHPDRAGHARRAARRSGPLASVGGLIVSPTSP